MDLIMLNLWSGYLVVAIIFCVFYTVDVIAVFEDNPVGSLQDKLLAFATVAVASLLWPLTLCCFLYDKWKKK